MLRFYSGCLFATFLFCPLHKKQIRRKDSWYRHTVVFLYKWVACEQALCLGKKTARKGKGKGEGGEGGGQPVDKHPEATFPPSCNYPADHLSVGKIVICQLISRVSKSWENYQEMSGVLLRLKTEWNHGVQASLSILQKVVDLRFSLSPVPRSTNQRPVHRLINEALLGVLGIRDNWTNNLRDKVGIIGKIIWGEMFYWKS